MAEMAGAVPSSRFKVQCENYVEYRRFGAFARSLTVQLLPPPVAGDSVSHFVKNVKDVWYGMRDCADSDMVGVIFRNQDTLRVTGMSQRK
jgi:hypothetical protein